MSYEKFDHMQLDDIASLAAAGDVLAIEFIVQKFKHFIKSKAKSYFLPGAENDDLIQEGMIGLIKAVRDYRNDKNASFKTFAELCITRQIITAIKMSSRQKHAPLNSYVSLYKEMGDSEGGDRYFMDELKQLSTSDPVDDMIRAEELKDVSAALKTVLSEFELKVLIGHIEGKSYQQMAEELGKTTKAVDNALQRVRKKASMLESIIE